MTGCPNGCARPYMAEIAFVGKAPGKYQIYLGGNEAGTRLNRLYKDWSKARTSSANCAACSRGFAASAPGERFGDFCARVLRPELPRPLRSLEFPASTLTCRTKLILPQRKSARSTEQFNGQPTEEILAWAWQRFGARAAIGTSFQGAGLVMMHLAKQTGCPSPSSRSTPACSFPKPWRSKRRLEDFFGFTIESLGAGPDRRGAGRHQRARTVEAQSRPLLHHPQSPAAARQTVRPGLLDHRPAPPAIRYPRRHRHRRALRLRRSLRPGHREAQPDGQLDAARPCGTISRQHRFPIIRCTTRATAPSAASPAPARPGNGEDERAGRWTGFNKVECGIHTFMPKKVDFQI